MLGFVSAVLKDWVSLMSGIASVILTIIGFFLKSHSQTRKTFWAAGLLCFLISANRVWANEHRLNIDLTQRLNEARPKLAGTISQIQTGLLVHQRLNLPARPLSLLTVSIRNLGADSIADQYSLTVRTPRGRRAVGVLSTLPGRFVINGYTYDNSGLLAGKTEEKPIERGGQRTGFLFFEFEHMELSSLQDKAAVFELSFKDVTGKACEVQNTATQPVPGPQWFPGTPLPVGPESTITVTQ